MDNIEKKVLVSFDSNINEARAAMSAYGADVKATAAELKELKSAVVNAKASIAQSNAEYSKEKVATQEARTEYQKKRTAILEANQALKQSKQAVEAANGSYKQAQQQLTALGNAIKNTENGFNSSNKAVKAQIAEYNKLNTQLKKFDAQMGNHQRSVGNYGSVLNGLNSSIGRLIPGFTQFSSILTGATTGFNALKSGATGAAEGAGEAEAGFAGLGGAALGLTAGLVGVAAAAAGVYAFLKDTATFSDGLSNSWAGLKASWVQFFNNIRDGNWNPFNQNIGEASDKAKELNQAVIDLNRDMLVSDVITNKENQFIATQMLKMRNLHTTAKEAEDIFQQVQQTAQTQYERVSEDAIQGFQTTAKQIKNTANLTQKEMAALMLGGSAVAKQFKEEGKHISDDLIAEFAKYQMMIDSAEGLKNQIDQRAQNREDQKIAKDKARKDKEHSEAEKAANDLLEAQRAGEEITNERRQALVKIIQDSQETFAKELSIIDENYRQKLFKQQDFIKKQEELRNKTKSPEAKAQFTKNIADANLLMGDFGKEHAADSDKAISDYFKKTKETIENGQSEIANLEIENITDVNKRSLALLDQKEKDEELHYQREQQLASENINKINDEIKDATDKGDKAKASALKRDLHQQEQLQGQSLAKFLAREKKYLADRAEMIKQVSDKEMDIIDQVDVLRAQEKDKKGGSKNDKALLDAEKTALLDKYNADVSAKGRTDAEKLLLEQQYLDAVSNLDDNYRQKQTAKILQWATLVQDSATNIIKQGLDRQSQAQELNLSRQKTFELNNQALTSTQKTIIDEKYRIKEGQEKVKQFKADQKLKIGIAVMDGAKAIVADLTLPAKIPFDIATTAAEIGVIAAQKPPAYAKGNIHYSSDGKGAYLRGPGSGTSDSMNAKLSNGEAVINAKSTSLFAPLLSAINQIGGGISFDNINVAKTGFATGGVFNTYLPVSDSGMRQQVSLGGRFHPDDIIAIAQSVANLPAPVMDIKDVNYAGQRLSGAKDLATF